MKIVLWFLWLTLTRRSIETHFFFLDGKKRTLFPWSCTTILYHVAFVSNSSEVATHTYEGNLPKPNISQLVVGRSGTIFLSSHEALSYHSRSESKRKNVVVLLPPDGWATV